MLVAPSALDDHMRLQSTQLKYWCLAPGNSISQLSFKYTFRGCSRRLPSTQTHTLNLSRMPLILPNILLLCVPEILAHHALWSLLGIFQDFKQGWQTMPTGKPCWLTFLRLPWVTWEWMINCLQHFSSKWYFQYLLFSSKHLRSGPLENTCSYATPLLTLSLRSLSLLSMLKYISWKLSPLWASASPMGFLGVRNHVLRLIWVMVCSSALLKFWTYFPNINLSQVTLPFCCMV